MVDTIIPPDCGPCPHSLPPPFHLQPAIVPDMDIVNPNFQVSQRILPRPSIRKLHNIRIHLQAQDDTGANVSATNRRDILWQFQTLNDPIPIQTYDDQPDTCQAIGTGYIHVISDDNSTMKWRTLFVPQSTGTILSPDSYMMEHPDIHSFHHLGDRSGNGTITFTTTNESPTISITMHRTHSGLWHTVNPILVPTPTPMIQQVQTTSTPSETNPTETPIMPPTDEEHPHETPVPLLDTPLPTGSVQALNPNGHKLRQYELWHQRLGHPSHDKMIQTQKVVTGIPTFPAKLKPIFRCPFCEKAKIVKLPGHKLAQRVFTHPGTAFHMDMGFIGGPTNLEDVLQHAGTPKGTQHQSRDGYVCYLLIIDAASRYIWVFPRKSKTPPIRLIQAFLRKHGRQSHRQRVVTTHPNGALANSPAFNMGIQEVGFHQQPQDPTDILDDLDMHHSGIVRTDNGGELAGSQQFRQTIQDAGYTLEVTAPDSSSQNGMAERPHRTLKDKVRCLLYTAGLGTTFWADALIHATWLYNRTHHSVTGTTPFEAYTGRKPVCAGILTFGSKVTPKKAKRRDNALDPNTYDGIFLGYCATTDNIRYWDVRAQRERHAKHLSHDELHYGAHPDQRTPAAQHLLALHTGTPHQERRTDTLLEPPTTVDTTHIRAAIAPTDEDSIYPLETHLLTEPVIQHTRSVTHHHREEHALVDDIKQFTVTLDPFCLVIKEKVPTRGQHPTLGLELAPHPQYPHKVRITGVKPGSMAAKHIRRYKTRLVGNVLDTVNGIRIDCPDTFAQQIHQLRQANTPHADIHIISTLDIALTGEGLPMIQFDQINVIAHHLQAIVDKQTGKSWTPSTTWPPIDPDQITHAALKGLGIPKLTRTRLLQSPHWPHFLQSEWTQLDKYAKQNMFGEPCPADSVGTATILPWVWTYLYKIDPVTLEEIPKARGTCNGGKRYGRMVTLAETYAACVEQPAHRLMWALVAALNYIAIGCDVANAFAEAPPPKETFYMRVDAQFQEWWTRHLKKPPIPSGFVIPILRNLQGHPEAPRLWHRHIHKILTEQLDFSATTHETCLYYKHTEDGKVILLLRQVDDFLIAAPTIDLGQQVRNDIQTFMANQLHDLGIVKRFNGVDIAQTQRYVKIHCSTYIGRILEHHGWDQEVHASLPVPMRTDTTYQATLQLEKGPNMDTKDATTLEQAMGFSYRQAIGELIFAMSICRLDISPAVIILSQHSAHPAKVHYQAVKAVFLYLLATQEDGIHYWRPTPREELSLAPDPVTITLPARLEQFPDVPTSTILHGATDATWAPDRAHRRSTGGIVFLLAGGAVYYKTRLQPDTAQSSTEAELYSMTDAGKAALYLRSLLEELGVEQHLPTHILADNFGATQLANAQQPTKRTRHVDMKHFVILQWTEEDKIKFEPTPTQFNFSDSVGKANARIKHYEHADILLGRRKPIYVNYLHAYIHDRVSTFRILLATSSPHSTEPSSVGR